MNTRTLTLVISMALVAGSALPAAADPSLGSPDWKLRNPTPTGDLLSSVVAGPAGFLGLSSNATLFHSANGAFWSPLAVSRSQHIHAIGTYPSGYFAVSDTSFIISPDAGSWREITVPDRQDGLIPFIAELAHSGSRWVALDRDRLLISEDAIHWNALQFPGRGGLYHLAAGPDCIVLVNGRLKDPSAPPPMLPDPSLVETVLQRVSYDGAWTETRLDGISSSSDVAYANGSFLVDGAFFNATSSDGIEWKVQPSVLQSSAHAWTGSRWVMWGTIPVAGSSPPAVASAGVLLTSTDGESWTSQTMSDVTDISAVAIRSDGVWVVTGWGTPADPQATAIATSTDGIRWQQRLSGSSPSLFHIARLRARWIAGGQDSTILCSDDGLIWRRSVLDETNPYLHVMRIQVSEGVAYAYIDQTTVYASRDGIAWAPTATYPDGRIPPSQLPEFVSSAGWPVWVGDRWLAAGTFGTVGIGQVMTSDDGVHWSKVLTTGLVVTAVGGRPGTYVAAESLGRIHVSNDGGRTWDIAHQFSDTSTNFTSIHVMDGWFIAGSTRGVYTSRDGRAWAPLTGSFDPFLGGAVIGESLWLTGVGGTLVEVTTRPPAPVANLSTRATVRPDRPPVIGGFVVEGTQPVQVLVRAVGDGLRRFDVSEVVRYPTLQIYRGAVEEIRAGDWAVSPQRDAIEALSTRVGAFPLTADGGDAAVALTVEPGAYTAVISDLVDPNGDVLIEVYDGDQHTPETSGGRLVNSSTRGPALDGHPLIGGFVVRGDRPRRILVRGIGPGLDRFGVPETADDPEIFLFRQREPIAVNRDWQATEDPLAVADAFHLTGAFTLAEGSKDAALLLTLEPGQYTAHVLPAGGTAPGEVLFEVYYMD